MSSSTAYDVDMVELDDAQATEVFNQVTQRAMGITGDEFLQRWDAGHYEGLDYDTVPGLVDVWMCLPFVR